MSRSHIRGRWRRALALLIAAQLVAACTGAPPAVLTSASPAAVVPTTFAASPVLRTPRPTRTQAPGPYDGVAVEVVEGHTVLLVRREVGYLAVTTDSVWAATNKGLVRIDPKTLKSDDIDKVGRFGLTAAKAVWVSDFNGGTVSRLDPLKGTPTASVELPGNPNAIAVLGDSVWVAQHRGGSVTRLEERSGKVVAVIDVGPPGSSGPHGVVADKTSVWVGVTNNQSVVRIDPATNTVVATIKTNTSPCGGLALQPDAVWVSTCFDDHLAVRIDPRTNALTAEIDIGGYNGGPILVDGYPWFPVYNQLVRVDPATNRVDRIVRFAKSAEFAAYGAVVGFDAVWIGGLGQVARIPVSALKD